jgi:hypothetical protein
VPRGHPVLRQCTGLSRMSRLTSRLSCGTYVRQSGHLRAGQSFGRCPTLSGVAMAGGRVTPILLRLHGRGTTIARWHDSSCCVRPEAPCSRSSR